jgi:plastocyanin
MRKLVLLAAAAASVAVFAVPALAATKSVKVGDNYYVRAKGTPTVTVKRGDTVKWTFQGRSPHDVAVSSGPVRFKSAVKSSGSFSRRMTRAGTYRIFCSIHGASDQKMVLKVR